MWSWSLHDDPFGENAPVSTSGYVFHLRFAGQYYDPETGLHYNLQRYYDPTVGRYVTSDPLGLSAGINTYAYVGSNPMRLIDPLGLAWSYSFGLNFTIVTPSTAFSMNLNAGFTVDGWRSTGFNQAQINIADAGASHGLFVGIGPTAALSSGRPGAGLNSAPYIESDVPFVSMSGSKDSCGKVDLGAARGVKIAPALGAGGFTGTSYSTTLVGPTLGTMLGR